MLTSRHKHIHGHSSTVIRFNVIYRSLGRTNRHREVCKCHIDVVGNNRVSGIGGIDKNLRLKAKVRKLRVSSVHYIERAYLAQTVNILSYSINSSRPDRHHLVLSNRYLQRKGVSTHYRSTSISCHIHLTVVYVCPLIRWHIHRQIHRPRSTRYQRKAVITVCYVASSKQLKIVLTHKIRSSYNHAVKISVSKCIRINIRLITVRVHHINSSAQSIALVTRQHHRISTQVGKIVRYIDVVCRRYIKGSRDCIPRFSIVVSSPEQHAICSSMLTRGHIDCHKHPNGITARYVGTVRIEVDLILRYHIGIGVIDYPASREEDIVEVGVTKAVCRIRVVCCIGINDHKGSNFLIVNAMRKRIACHIALSDIDIDILFASNNHINAERITNHMRTSCSLCDHPCGVSAILHIRHIDSHLHMSAFANRQYERSRQRDGQAIVRYRIDSSNQSAPCEIDINIHIRRSVECINIVVIRRRVVDIEEAVGGLAFVANKAHGVAVEASGVIRNIYVGNGINLEGNKHGIISRSIIVVCVDPSTVNTRHLPLRYRHISHYLSGITGCNCSDDIG